MENQITQGDVIEVKGIKLECTFISYQEIDGKRINYTYSFRPHEDMERERIETVLPESNQSQEA